LLLLDSSDSSYQAFNSIHSQVQVYSNLQIKEKAANPEELFSNALNI